MQIIDYFQSENQEHWRAQIAQYEWRAAKYLAHLLAAGEFQSFVGKGTLYLLTDEDKLVSFASLAERDCIDVAYTPWIGFVHTAPEYRGHRYVGKLIDHACAVAGEHGASRVYICTDHVGLYEKYGFTYLENRLDRFGGESRIYYRETEKKKVSFNMKKGRIIFLNGVTSSGKTSIVEALQDRTDCYFYVVANDLFQEMVGERFLRENYWLHLSRVIILMYHTAKMMSDMGHDVLIDGILVERPEITPHYQQLIDILEENPLYIVEVDCPLEICRARNIARGDRHENQSEEQAVLMANDIQYAMTVRSDQMTPAECADAIVKRLIK